MLKQFGVSAKVLMKLIRKAVSKYLLETALRKKQSSAPFVYSTLFITFYLQKANKNEMLKKFGASNNEIYQ